MLACVEADRATENYFLRVTEALLPGLGDRPDASSIKQAVHSLVELFRALRNYLKTGGKDHRCAQG